MRRIASATVVFLLISVAVALAGAERIPLASSLRPAHPFIPIEARETGDRSLLAATCDGDEDELLYDDGVFESQIGGGSDGVQFAMVFTIPATDSPGDVMLNGVRVTISGSGGIVDPAPFYVCVYDATAGGGPTGSPLATCEGPFDPPAFDVWYDIELTTPVAVGSSGDFAVALDQASSFISLASDNTDDVNRSWVSADNGSTWALDSAYGLPGNYLLRAVTCTEVTTTTTATTTTTTTIPGDDDTDDDADDDADDDVDDDSDDDADDDVDDDADDDSNDDDNGGDDDSDDDSDDASGGGSGGDDDDGGCCG